MTTSLSRTMTNEDKKNLDTLNEFAGTTHLHPLNLESDFRVNFEKYLLNKASYQTLCYYVIDDWWRYHDYEHYDEGYRSNSWFSITRVDGYHHNRHAGRHRVRSRIPGYIFHRHTCNYYDNSRRRCESRSYKVYSVETIIKEVYIEEIREFFPNSLLINFINFYRYKIKFGVPQDVKNFLSNSLSSYPILTLTDESVLNVNSKMTALDNVVLDINYSLKSRSATGVETEYKFNGNDVKNLVIDVYIISYTSDDVKSKTLIKHLENIDSKIDSYGKITLLTINELKYNSQYEINISYSQNNTKDILKQSFYLETPDNIINLIPDTYALDACIDTFYKFSASTFKPDEQPYWKVRGKYPPGESVAYYAIDAALYLWQYCLIHKSAMNGEYKHLLGIGFLETDPSPEIGKKYPYGNIYIKILEASLKFSNASNNNNVYNFCYENPLITDFYVYYNKASSTYESTYKHSLESVNNSLNILEMYITKNHKKVMALGDKIAGLIYEFQKASGPNIISDMGFSSLNSQDVLCNTAFAEKFGFNRTIETSPYKVQGDIKIDFESELLGYEYPDM